MPSFLLLRSMEMDREFIQTLKQVANERDIPVNELIADLETALAAAYKKHVGATGDVTVRIDTEKGSLNAVIEKEVVGLVSNHFFQISLEEARKRDKDIEIGDFIPVEIAPESFGRIAAATFKQVLQQKLRDAEKRRTMEEFNDKIGDIVSGSVIRREGLDVVLLVGRSECYLKKEDQVFNEPYRINDKMKVYVSAIDSTRRDPRVFVSRKDEKFVLKLFEAEVPEIATGTVEIVGIAREPGIRTKIAVKSNDERVDAVGSCVGQRGARVQAIVNELYDEKIDIVPYSDNPVEYITSAMSPAKVSSVKLASGTEKIADIIVPESQKNLAIGKGGKNAKLVEKLTGWKVNIMSDQELADEAVKK